MRDLTKGNIYKSFVLFAVPLILSGLLSQAYHVIDTAIAGRFLGEQGLAAIGATSQAIVLVSSVFWGFSTGLGVYIAKLFGAREYSRIRNDIYNSLIIISAVILSISLLLILFDGYILDFLSVDAHIRRDAEIYFDIYIAGLTFIVLNATFIQIMNAMGASSYPLYMSILSAVLNISGNIISVTVFDAGVAGIAIASVFAAVAADAFFLLKLRSNFKKMKLGSERFKLSLSSFSKTLRYGFPSALQQSAMYIASLIMSPIVNGIGADATAGYTVALRINDINSGIYQNSSKTLSNYSAQCIGAKKYEKLSKALFVGLLQGVVFVLPTVILCCVFAYPINAMFFPDGFSGKAFEYAVCFSRYILPFVFVNLINNLFHSFFRGIAAMNYLIIATVIGSVGRIAAGIILSRALGMTGVYIAFIVGWTAEAIFVSVIYLLKLRNSKMIQKFIEKNGL